VPEWGASERATRLRLAAVQACMHGHLADTISFLFSIFHLLSRMPYLCEVAGLPGACGVGPWGRGAGGPPRKKCAENSHTCAKKRPRAQRRGARRCCSRAAGWLSARGGCHRKG
jgi:hypothetical protein